MNAVIDQKALDSLDEMALAAGAPQFTVSLIETYLGSLANALETMEEAVSKGDAHALYFAAHTIKSPSLSLGAMAFAKLSEDVEVRARKPGAVPVTARDIAALRDESKRVIEALNQEVVRRSQHPLAS